MNKIPNKKIRVRLEYLRIKLDKFFKENNGYNDEMLVKEFNLDLLEWYARLGLGEKILKCVQEKGYCEFQAEL